MSADPSANGFAGKAEAARNLLEICPVAFVPSPIHGVPRGVRGFVVARLVCGTWAGRRVTVPGLKQLLPRFAGNRATSANNRWCGTTALIRHLHSIGRGLRRRLGVETGSAAPDDLYAGMRTQPLRGALGAAVR